MSFKTVGIRIIGKGKEVSVCEDIYSFSKEANCPKLETVEDFRKYLLNEDFKGTNLPCGNLHLNAQQKDVIKHGVFYSGGSIIKDNLAIEMLFPNQEMIVTVIK